MNIPTEEQIKEFWERCGFKWRAYASAYVGEVVMKVHDATWVYPDGETHFKLPPIDLNNLFRWAVPKANSLGWGVGLMPCGNVQDSLWYGDTFNIWKEVHYRESNPKMDDPALALFWAIWKVIKGAK